MSLTKKILETARSGLSQITSLVIVDDEPLSVVDPAALEKELAARRAAREHRGKKPGDDPLARLAGAGEAARAQRKKLADEREGKARAEKAAKQARDQAAADEAYRRIKQQAAAGGAGPASAGPGPGPGSSGARTPKPGSSQAQVAEWYRVLDLPVGADMPAVKSAYRKMMRKYHPDLHTGDERKQKAATELSMRVTNAYNNLRTHLGDK
jgi:hypothetical protein